MPNDIQQICVKAQSIMKTKALQLLCAAIISSPFLCENVEFKDSRNALKIQWAGTKLKFLPHLTVKIAYFENG